MHAHPDAAVDIKRMLCAPRGDDAASERRALLAGISDERLPYLQGAGGRTLFHVCILHADVDWVSALLEDGRLDPNERDNGFTTPLQLAARRGNARAMKILVASDRVDVNLVHYRCCTALHLAAINDHPEVVQHLLACERVDANAPDFRAQTALHHAVRNNNWDVVAVLSKSPRVNPNAQDDAESSALHTLAERRENGDRLPMLLGMAGIDVNLKDCLGRTALMHACMHGSHRALTHFATDARVDVGAVDTLGRVAAHYLCDSAHDTAGFAVMAPMLRGTFHVVETREGLTPAEWAFKRFHYERLASIVSMGAIDVRRPFMSFLTLMDALGSRTDHIGMRDRVMLALAHDLTDQEAVRYARTFPSVRKELRARLAYGPIDGRRSDRSRSSAVSCLVLASKRDFGVAKPCLHGVTASPTKCVCL